MSLHDNIVLASLKIEKQNDPWYSKITDTTLSECGETRAKIDLAINSTLNSRLSSEGFVPDRLDIVGNICNRALLLTNDPLTQNLLISGSDATRSSIDSSFVTFSENSNTPSQISEAAKSAMTQGVANYTSYINSVDPSLTSSISPYASGLLVDTYTYSDSMCSRTAEMVKIVSQDKKNEINNKLIDRVTAANKASPSVAKADAAISSSPVSNKGVYTSQTSSIGSDVNNTDIIYQDLKVYIEGVQVPYISGVINQAMGAMPSASISIPPQASLLDIARYYQPKVHIFYRDQNYGGDRLLFWGHIVASNYSKSRGSGSGSISFECVHRLNLLNQLTMEWSGSGLANVSGPTPNNTNPENVTIQVNNFSSLESVLLAMQGISGLASTVDELLSKTKKLENSKVDVSKLDIKYSEFEQRLVGMPGVIMNLWNQIKRQAYSTEKLNVILSNVYIPLIEDGLQFFNRIAGHYILEKQIDSSRQLPCNHMGKPISDKEVMIPPSYRNNFKSAQQSSMAVQVISSMMGFTGENSTFHNLVSEFMQSIEYMLVTLASPSELPVDPTRNVNPDDPTSWALEPKMAAETILRPNLPFYYSPICNVILPNLFTSISINQTESEIPTRITVINGVTPESQGRTQGLATNYRAPHSIREAVAIGASMQADLPLDLSSTLSSPYYIPGKYELGRGINHYKVAMPSWLSYMSISKDQSSAANSQSMPDPQTAEYKALENLHEAWIDRYGYKTEVLSNNDTKFSRDESKDGLDPYSLKSKIRAYQSLLFSAADFEFSKKVVQTKSGNLEGIFNPYIVPGYPMDIIQASPVEPSFHALCASVTHVFTANSISTSISFVAAVTYNELSTYFMSPIHPWLQTSLRMVNVARAEATSTVTTTTTTPSSVGTTSVSSNTIVAQEPNPVLFARSKSLQSISDYSDAQSRRIMTRPTPPPQDPLLKFPGDATLDVNDGAVLSVSQTLLNNPRAKQVADEFYRNVFCVGAAAPDDIYDYKNGIPTPVSRNNGNWFVGSPSSNEYDGRELNDNLTGVGNLRLVSRPIESKESIESKFGIKFIDMIPTNYTPTFINYINQTLSNNTLLEPGASQFLDYEEVKDFIKRVN